MQQPKFEIGDRVTYASPELPYQKNRGIGEVVWETVSHYYIIWADDPKMECPYHKELAHSAHEGLIKILELQTVEASKIDSLPEIAKPKKAKKPKPKPSLPVGIKLGDHVRDLETGGIGKVTHLCDRCITIKTRESIESHNLELGTPKLEILTHPNQVVVFAIGDRITLVSEGYSMGKYGMGATLLEKRWDKRKGITWMTVQFDDGSIASNHIEGSGWFKLLETTKIDNLPEIAPPDLHGYFEHYQPVIKGEKSYWYRRYVYVDISGKLRHHHVPNKMVESIETLWRSGASAKEICLALGKSSK